MWKEIPIDTEILITHSPPLDVMDFCEGNNEGMQTLKNRIKEVKPLYHIFGHTHEGYGTEKIDDTVHINCSTCDADYKPVNKPLVFYLKKK